MLLGTVYIHVQREATGRWEKALEGYGTRQKHVERYGSLWKTQEQSIDRYISDGQGSLESWTKREGETK